jgi:hypothetical protein
MRKYYGVLIMLLIAILHLCFYLHILHILHRIFAIFGFYYAFRCISSDLFFYTPITSAYDIIDVFKKK